MSTNPVQNQIEAYGQNSEVIVQAYTEILHQLSQEWNTEIDLTHISPYEIHTGNTEIEKGDAYAQLSDTEDYKKEMLEKFCLTDGVDTLIESTDYPLHEVVESAGHLAAEVAADGRKNEDMRDTAVNELFGAYSLGLKEPILLENDRKILERNLELQQEFFGEKQFNHVFNSLDEYTEIASIIHDRATYESSNDIIPEIRTIRSNLAADTPATLNDFNKYSWSSNRDVGTFSEFFIDTFVTPVEDIKSADNIEQELDANAEFLANMEKPKLRKVNDYVHNIASENNVAYLISRRLAEESLHSDLFDLSFLVEKDNFEVWNHIREDALHKQEEIKSEYNIPDRPKDLNR